MKWIEKIVNIENFKVNTLWNDGKIRSIDLKEFIESKSQNPKSSYAKLLDLSVFELVKCDGTSLYWDDLLIAKDIDGSEISAPLDISPEFLFELAKEEFKQVI